MGFLVTHPGAVSNKSRTVIIFKNGSIFFIAASFFIWRFGDFLPQRHRVYRAFFKIVYPAVAGQLFLFFSVSFAKGIPPEVPLAVRHAYGTDSLIHGFTFTFPV